MRRPNNSITRGRLRARSGVTLPFIVLLIAVFIGVTAFAIDVSRMFVIRAELQTSADAGAIAGAMQLLPGATPAAGYDSALVYAQRNAVEKVAPDVAEGDIVPGRWHGIAFVPSNGWTDPTTNAVQVTTHHDGAYVFGPIYHVLSSAVAARAIAAIGSVTASSCVRPIAVPYEVLLRVLYPDRWPGVPYDSAYPLSDTDVERLRAATIANVIDLKLGAQTDVSLNGEYYGIDEPPIEYWNGDTGVPITGGNTYGELLGLTCPPYVITEGDWLLTETGKMVGPTLQGMSQHPECQAGVCDPPLKFTIPIWNYYRDGSAAGGHGRQVHVRYIGVFMVTGYGTGGGPNASDIKGYFSVLKGTGSYDTLPGPVMRAALVH